MSKEMISYSVLGTQFNSDVRRDLENFDKQIKEEAIKGAQADNEKIMNLRMAKLYRGMELNSGIGYNNLNRGIPY